MRGVCIRLICMIRGHDWVQTHLFENRADEYPRPPVRRYCARCGARQVYLPGHGEDGIWMAGHNALPYPDPAEVEASTVGTLPPVPTAK